MQLKRDTDYALRLLLKLREKAAIPETALSLRELCSETGIPVIIAARILESLKAKQIVCTAETANNRSAYYLDGDAGRVSLYDLISVIEGKAELFAAFNKSNSAYSQCREKLLFTETEVKECLSHVILADLIGRETAEDASDRG